MAPASSASGRRPHRTSVRLGGKQQRLCRTVPEREHGTGVAAVHLRRRAHQTDGRSRHQPAGPRKVQARDIVRVHRVQADPTRRRPGGVPAQVQQAWLRVVRRRQPAGRLLPRHRRGQADQAPRRKTYAYVGNGGAVQPVNCSPQGSPTQPAPIPVFAPPSTPFNCHRTNLSLAVDTRLCAQDTGKACLTIQGDGNLVVYDERGRRVGHPIRPADRAAPPRSRATAIWWCTPPAGSRSGPATPRRAIPRM